MTFPSPSKRTLSGLLLLAAAWCAAPSAAAAEPPRYALDPVHTRVMFAVEHAGFSKAIGTVSGSTGTLAFDPEDWTTATLEASVPIARLDLGDAKWNKATLADNLLDADDHPAATFVSTRVEPVAPDRASVFGTLTLRGVSKEVVLDVKLNALKRHPLPPFRRTVGFSATTTLSRKDFGITAWPSVIGDAVELRIEAEATRMRRGDRDDDDLEDTRSSQPPDDTAAETPAAESSESETPETPPTDPAEPATEPAR